MSKLIAVANTTEIPPGEARAFDVDGNRIAVFNIDGTYHAIEDTCTHQGGPLSEGSIEGCQVECPWHGARFDLKTGDVLCPPAPNAVKAFRVITSGDEIQIEL